ncbi:hypothetical protein GOP47_0016826 [Adiantum capillus-veneris]|uniref:F-box domain-containing protein n=1 Tax=Adiantum capillus-veneris TaxID=13818 RepID=A0A9D4UIF4_ADICA|nr:hypothetical protein GOP47_0016826 [Adiantum capillus-veneris]
MAELLPGLNDKVALRCLARAPRIYHTALRAVNKIWREVVGSKEFYTVRKQLNATEERTYLMRAMAVHLWGTLYSSSADRISLRTTHPQEWCEGRGLVTDAEVYDADADSWSRIATLPFALHTDIVCIWRNKLVVRGTILPEKRQYVFSYSPANNEWEEEKWLVNVFSSFKPLISMATGVTTKSDDSLLVGLAEHSYQGRVMEDYVSLVKVMKLDKNTVQWKALSKYRDEADEANCERSIDVAPPLFIFGLRDRILVMNHLEYEDMRMFKLVFSRGIAKLFVTCPSEWVSTMDT